MKSDETNLVYLRMACEIARANADRGGGPSGAVIVDGDAVMATGADSVALDGDPTAHAVVNAIRRACQLKRSSRLEACTVYCSCEPCPMCLGALHLAGVDRICYANAQADSLNPASGGSFICSEIAHDELEQRLRRLKGGAKNEECFK